MCGPSVLNMAVEAHKPGIAYSVFKRMTYREELNGTLKSDIIGAARRLGLAPYRVPSMSQMLTLVEHGQPVIVFQNLGVSWLPAWHYSLLVGYRADRNAVYLHTGKEPYQELGFSRFHATWRRGGKWSYVVVPAGVIPEHVPFAEALDNAVVFENLGQKDVALAIYTGMAGRWPERFEPHLGLASLHYQSGNLRPAIAEMRLALDRNPNHPDLIANLALLYEESGQPTQAKRLKSLAQRLQ